MRPSRLAAAAAVTLLLLPVRDARGQDTRPVGRTESGVIVPTHQHIEPAGRQVEFGGRPTDLVLLQGGRVAAVKNAKSLTIVDLREGRVLHDVKVPKDGFSFHGIAASEDGRAIFVTGSHNRLWIADLGDGPPVFREPILLRGPAGKGNSAPGGIALDAEGRLLVALSRNNALAVVDPAKRTVIAEIPVGTVPCAVVRHGNLAFVSNWGGRRPRPGDVTDTSSGTPIVVDPVTNTAASGTVSIVDLGRREAVTEIETGLHPSGLALDPRRGLLYVANANSDSVSVIRIGSRSVIRTLDVKPDASLPFGSAPNALALSDDGGRLFVANGTNNAVAVIDVSGPGRILGYMPVGWYPGALRFDGAAGRVVVANVKGVGSLEPVKDRAGRSVYDYRGSLTILEDMSETALARGTEIARRTNRVEAPPPTALPPRRDVPKRPVPARHGEPSVFRHVLYIIKENRTYDQVLGDQPRGNGDPSLCIFGRQVTPNHHAITDEWVLLDNFYCSGVLSADGHQWTDEAYVTDYLEKMFGGFVRSYPYEGSDPMAWAPTGFLWDNALRHGRTFRNYGEMVQATITPKGTWKELYEDYVRGTGTFTIRATSHIDALRANMCETFIGFPGTVTDVWRASQFLGELREAEARGTWPNLMMMLLPNDHTAGTREGYPTPDAAVADNDLALGRIVEAVSRSRFWRETCIFVVEDDPQNGWDHVDGHRTVAMVVSPWTKRGAVVSTRYTQPSMVKTIELILGLPPMNQMDLLAEPMTDCFAETFDPRPYTCRDNVVPLDRMNAAIESLRGSARRDALASMGLPLEDVDQADEETFNRILWHAMKGHDVPYPKDR